MRAFRNGRLLAAVLALALIATASAAAFSPGQAAAQDEVSAAAILPGTDAVVADGPLNQRSAGNIGGVILQVLDTGDVVAVISGPTFASGYSWFLVTAFGVNGYVAGEFLAEIGFLIGDSVFVDTDALNVRSGAGTGFGIIDVIFEGTLATILGGPSAANGYNWYQIQYGGLQGWVAGVYLSLAAGPPPPGIGFGSGSWIICFDGPVNMRSAAGTGSGILRTIGQGEAVSVTSGPTAANGYSWYAIADLNGLAGYVAGDFFTGGFYLDDLAIVAEGPLNQRSAPGTGSAILQSLATNQSVFVESILPVLSGPNTWFNVTANGITGWVAGQYLGPLLV